MAVGDEYFLQVNLIVWGFFNNDQTLPNQARNTMVFITNERMTRVNSTELSR